MYVIGAAAEPDLTAISIEQLMEIEITSVAKKPQPLSQSAAAVFVITAEDIRRSGVTTIPDALRMVPGLHVARIDANKWAVTARGFNGRFANKLLVLMDGRSVYTPFFSGVYWDIQDTLLADIERIEVIRGPGAAIWGANAVNGVINIITKSAKNTRGGLVSAGFGEMERAFGSVRYGGDIGEDRWYRIFAKYFDRDESAGGDFGAPSDEWQGFGAGLRFDAEPDAETTLTVIGRFYADRTGTSAVRPSPAPPFLAVEDIETEAAAASLQARWTRRHSLSDFLTFQAYYDRTDYELEIARESRNTLDLEFQHGFTVAGIHRVQWGLGYRLSRDDVRGSSLGRVDPEERTDHLFSAFVQDDIALFPDIFQGRFRLIAGAKFEHNGYSGSEVQPNLRFIYPANDANLFWGAISRAVRTPSRVEHDAVLSQPFPPMMGTAPVRITLMGSDDFDAETVIAHELGYRYHPWRALSVDIAGFYNRYDNLRTFEPVTPSAAAVDNGMSADAYGIEISANAAPTDWWMLKAGYGYFEVQLDLASESRDPISAPLIRRIPRHQVSLRSQFDLPRNMEADLWLRHVGDIDDEIPGYTALDVRLGWRPSDRLELSLVGRNLLDESHPEFLPDVLQIVPGEVARSVYAKATLRF